MNSQSKIDDVVTILKDRIDQGIYSAGQKLPSERGLAEELKVNRSTIRTALLRLQSENHINIVPRGGVFVQAHPPKVTMGELHSLLPKNTGPELQQVGSFIHLLRSQGRNVVVRYLEPSKLIPADQEISSHLGIQTDEQVLRRFRVQLIDNVPYRILDTYLLASLATELEGQEDHKVPLFKWLHEHKDFTSSRASERLQCRMPTSSEASTLNISRYQPVVEMDRWIWGVYESSSEEVLFEYSKIIANASLHDFTYSYLIDEDASK